MCSSATSLVKQNLHVSSDAMIRLFPKFRISYDRLDHGLGALNGFSDFFLASSSAISLPSTPECPGTQIKVVLFATATHLMALMQSHMSLDPTSYAPIILRVAMLEDLCSYTPFFYFPDAQLYVINIRLKDCD